MAFLHQVHTITDKLFAHHCFLCNQRSNGLLCEHCRNSLPTIDTCCTQCALPLSQNQLCPECLQHSPSYDRIVSAFEYYFPLPHLVHAFKHKQHLRSGQLLTKHLSCEVAKCDSHQQPDYLCQVPLHWRKRTRRGFNQAAYIAKYLARERQIPYLNLLEKTRVTASQQNLNRKDRLRNLGNSFAIKEKNLKRVAGSFIVIVDDVVTTGATAEILSGLLKEKGARRVEMWCLARTPKSTQI